MAVPILVYHRFGARVTDAMTVTDDTFSWQIQYLKAHGYTVVPLLELVNYFRGMGVPSRVHSIVITADDGHRSVYSDMLPIVRWYGIHVTLFIYPSAISNAGCAMTWQRKRRIVKRFFSLPRYLRCISVGLADRGDIAVFVSMSLELGRATSAPLQQLHERT